MSDKPTRILIVEDDVVDRKAIKKLLDSESVKYEISFANSYNDGLERLKTSVFDIILSDYNLGDGFGVDLLESAGETPLVIITGSGDEETAAHSVRLGAYDYLVKDPSCNYLSVLTATVESVLVRKKTQKALKESEERYRQLVELSPETILAHNEGTIKFINTAGVNLLGYKTSDELIGKPVLDIVHPRFREPVAKRINRLHSTGYSIPFMEQKLLRANGTTIDVEVTGALVTFDDKPSSLVVIRDIAERKRAEEERKNLVEDLGKALDEETKAKAIAEEATLLKDKFVNLVAHDLKSPFCSMLGLIRLFAEDEELSLSKNQSDLLRSVLDSGDRMTMMISDLLDLSRFSTGKIGLKRKFCDAGVVASAAIRGSENQAKEKGITVTNEIPEGMRLFVDHTLIGQVLKNLISNAIKFSRKGDSVTLFIKPDPDFVIVVKDTGVGVMDELSSDLFKSEVKTTTLGTSGEVGTGLGLPYCMDIIKAAHFTENGHRFQLKLAGDFTPNRPPVSLETGHPIGA